MNSYIHLIRHGMTEGNQRRLFYGSSDILLSEEGKKQIRSFAAKGLYPQAEGADCYTTDMIRTQQTFRLIYGDRSFKVLKNMGEMHFGKFEMKSFADLEGDPEYLEWQADKTGTRSIPGGESIAQFNARVSDGYARLVGLHRLKELSVRHNGRDAVSILVCHGGVIGSILMESFPDMKDRFWEWIPDAGRGYSLKLKDGRAFEFSRI